MSAVLVERASGCRTALALPTRQLLELQLRHCKSEEEEGNVYYLRDRLRQQSRNVFGAIAFRSALSSRGADV